MLIDHLSDVQGMMQRHHAGLFAPSPEIFNAVWVTASAIIATGAWWGSRKLSRQKR
jgi:hypothetical protein